MAPDIEAIAGTLIARFHPDVSARRSTAKPAVVYVLAQPHRLGQLTSELYMVRTLYPVDQYEVFILAPQAAMRRGWVNDAVLRKFTDGMTVIERPDGDMIKIGLTNFGPRQRDDVTYLLLNPIALTKAFIGHTREKQARLVLELDDEERARGIELKQRLGVNPDARVVAVHARDSGYLPTLGYHSFRDADIRNYIPTIQLLLSRGYVVVRLGDQGMRRCEIQDANFIDAPWHPQYEGFLDLYIIATSKFFLATTSGPCWIGQAFATPTVYLNCQVQSHLYVNDADLYAYKKYFVHRAGRSMSYVEIAMSDLPGLHMTQHYMSRGVALIECSPVEIRQVALEMEARLDNLYKANERVEAHIQSINDIADRARRAGLIADERHQFFAPALTKAKLSTEMINLNPGFLL